MIFNLKVMKHLFSILLCAVLFCSCNNDDESYKIKYVIRANTDSVIHVFSPKEITIKECWEYEKIYEADSYLNVAAITCSCSDSETLLIGEIYVNGDLKVKDDANNHLQVSYNFK